MEAFLPDVERVKDSSSGSAKRAERFLLSEAWDAQDPKGPYPIINTNLILVNSPTLKYRLRGGDNFALTPWYCGSNATGWASTEKFAGGTLTLATAMAISGAAVNPNTAVGGKGLTRNRFVSAVMTLLNLRLGFWVRRPCRCVGRRSPAEPLASGSHILHSPLRVQRGTEFPRTQRRRPFRESRHLRTCAPRLSIDHSVRRRAGYPRIL